MERLEKVCPWCKGEIGFWIDGRWHPCRPCKTQGVVKVASMAEYRRMERSVTNPEKAQTKQREKGR